MCRHHNEHHDKQPVEGVDLHLGGQQGFLLVVQLLGGRRQLLLRLVKLNLVMMMLTMTMMMTMTMMTAMMMTMMMMAIMMMMAMKMTARTTTMTSSC